MISGGPACYYERYVVEPTSATNRRYFLVVTVVVVCCAAFATVSIFLERPRQASLWGQIKVVPSPSRPLRAAWQFKGTSGAHIGHEEYVPEARSQIQQGLVHQTATVATPASNFPNIAVHHTSLLWFTLPVSILGAAAALWLKRQQQGQRHQAQVAFAGGANLLQVPNKKRSELDQLLPTHLATTVAPSGEAQNTKSQADSYLDMLRGKNLDDSSFAREGTEMQFVEVEQGADELPQYYDVPAIQAYYAKRPIAVSQRLVQLFAAFSSLAGAFVSDQLQNRLDEPEYQAKRAALLREIVTKLGPFFIKFGQALSIRPDVVSQVEMAELQRLCDKVPPFDNQMAMDIIRSELGPVESVFAEITSEPVAAASLGQVYKAKLKSDGTVVAVKVQRPYVLETVALDLYLVRLFGETLKNLKFLQVKSDLVALVDEFAGRFYSELDYRLECDNGLRIAEDLKGLANIVIPKPYPEYTTKRVHTAQWIEGEKLSISQADNVGELVSLGTVAYLTQLLGTGLFHADPHPGNLIRTTDGQLAILDFGLMTEINDQQKYGFIEAIAHLVHRDYEKIGDDFVNLGFLPEGTDVKPLLPVLGRVFDMALKGGGAKGINFNQLAGDLAKITYDFPFRIPPFLALVIRAIGVLEGIALVGNPDFAIIRAAYPYISERLLTDQSDRMKETLRYLIYGKDDVFNVRRVIDLLENVDTYTAVSTGQESQDGKGIREALIFIFSSDGEFIRKLLLEEVAKSVDALNRDALYELVRRIGINNTQLPPLVQAAAPELSDKDKQAIENLELLVNFTLGNLKLQEMVDDLVKDPRGQGMVSEVADILPEIAPGMQQFGIEIVSLLTQKLASRVFRFSFGVADPQKQLPGQRVLA